MRVRFTPRAFNSESMGSKMNDKENPPSYRQWHDTRCNVCKHQNEFDDWEVVHWWCDKYAGGGQLGMTCDAFEAE